MSKKAVQNEKGRIKALSEAFHKMFLNVNMEEESSKQKEAYANFKRHFPDAIDERFQVFDVDGKFNVDYKKGEGSFREIWGDGEFLVDPDTFSENLKRDLGRKILFPYTLLLTTEKYSLNPTPFSHSTKSIPTDLKVYVTPDKFFVAKMKKPLTPTSHEVNIATITIAVAGVRWYLFR